MKRMLARIDIRNNSATSNFTVEEVYLANYNTTGYIAPAWNTNGQVTDPVPDTPVLPRVVVNDGRRGCNPLFRKW